MPTRPTSHDQDLIRRGLRSSRHVLDHQRRRNDPTQREADRLRGTARWKRLRRWWLVANPLCVACVELGVTTPAREVDHIEPLRRNLERCFDVTNLASLCRPCHARKSGAERG